jgi:glycosyltransferase involved in cell wall biosynthesis
MVTPAVSVVLPVFNGAARLRQSVDSVLSQEGIAFELIVVDDGSTDETPAILAEYARRDPRVRLVRQENAGITIALIRGCDAALAPLIARQDCGDLSLPGRLVKTAELFDDPEIALASCQAVWIAPGGEYLYVAEREGEALRQTLLHADGAHLHGLPHHGSAMFRTDVYRRLGGYRRQFYFAQDIDLWVRFAQRARIGIQPEALYQVLVAPGTISGRHRHEQLLLQQLAVQLRDARSEEETARLLAAAAEIRPESQQGSPRKREAEQLYFIASCLRENRDPAARRYLLQAIRRNPLHWRAWVRLMTG